MKGRGSWRSATCPYRWRAWLVPLSYSHVKQNRPYLLVASLHVEPEENDVAIFDDVFLAFEADVALFFGFGHRAGGDEVVVVDDSARMKPRLMSEWITPAASTALVPCGWSRADLRPPAVRKLMNPRVRRRGG